MLECDASVPLHFRVLYKRLGQEGGAPREFSFENERRDDPKKYWRKRCLKRTTWIFEITTPPFNGLPNGVMKGKVKNDFQTFMGSRVSQPVVKLFYNEILNTDRFLFHFLKDVELVTTGDDLSTAIQARLPTEPFPNRSEGVSVLSNGLERPMAWHS